MGGCGFANEVGEVVAAAVVLLPVLFVVVPVLVIAEVVFVVEFVVFVVEEPAAVDAGEEVFEEVGGGAFGVEGVRRRPVSSGSVSGPVCWARVSSMSSSCSRRPAGSGRRPSAMWRAWRTRPVTASYGEVPDSRSSRTWVGVSWGRASMLSASKSTAVGEWPVASTVTSAAAASQWAAAMAAAVGSMSVNSAAGPKGFCSRRWSAAATWTGRRLRG
ncbi:hypothetical protein ACFQ0M_34210 [Kitasatospora aburaviensis]